MIKVSTIDCPFIICIAPYFESPLCTYIYLHFYKSCIGIIVNTMSIPEFKLLYLAIIYSIIFNALVTLNITSIYCTCNFLAVNNNVLNG